MPWIMHFRLDFISGDDLAENVRNLEKNAAEVEARVEKEKSALEEDVKKLNTIIGEIMGWILTLEKELEKKKEELRTKEEKEGRLREENRELKKSFLLQSRDTKRMKKELQSVEAEIADADTS